MPLIKKMFDDVKKLKICKMNIKFLMEPSTEVAILPLILKALIIMTKVFNYNEYIIFNGFLGW